MAYAINLAKQTFVQTLPNPKVACVIVSPAGEIIAEGVHGELGKDHAEVIALGRAGRSAEGATAYVTLEPCAHTGRTGPCVDALHSAGIKRVVFASKDTINGGEAMLRQKHIEVMGGVLEKEASETLAPWLHAVECQTPYVTLKIASTLDGYIAAADGTSQWITSEESRHYVQKIRLDVDGIVTSTNTVKHDNPQYTVRDFGVNFQPHVYVLGKSALENFSHIEGRYTLIDSHNPGDLLDTATADGKKHLLIEAGGKVAGAFLKANLVNRIIWMSAPIVLGDGVSAVQGLGISSLKDALKGQIAEQFMLGGDIITVLRMNRCSH